MRNVKYAPNSQAVGVVSNAQRRAKRAPMRERRTGGIPDAVQVVIGIASVIIGLIVVFG